MKTARGTLRTPQRIDRTRHSAKLRGPACCPACQRIRENEPVASVTLSGEFLAAHRDEILARVRACERAENRTHPLKRIMAVSPGARELRVTTTDAHLARRIGEALRRAYKGELSYRYPKGERLLQVTWAR